MVMVSSRIVGGVVGFFLASSCVCTGSWVAVEEQVTVTTTATGYDARGSNDGGCGTTGCTPALSRDGNVIPDSRWSCSTSIAGVDECSITYEFSSRQAVQEVRIAFYRGDERTRRFKIISDDVTESEAEYFLSAGEFLQLEAFRVNRDTSKITILSTPESDPVEWFSLTEVTMVALQGIEISESSNGVSVSATGFDDRTNSGCNGPCLPSNTREGDFDDGVSRWSCLNSEATGGLCSIAYTFNSATTLTYIRISFYKGDERERALDIYYNGIYEGFIISEGDTLEYLDYYLDKDNVSEVNLVARDLGTEWISLNNVHLYVL